MIQLDPLYCDFCDGTTRRNASLGYGDTSTQDKKIELPNEYSSKPMFHIVNEVYARHEGNPATIQNTYNDMLAYIQQKKLQQITAAYNV